VDIFDLFDRFPCVQIHHAHLATLIAKYHEFRPLRVDVYAGNCAVKTIIFVYENLLLSLHIINV